MTLSRRSLLKIAAASGALAVTGLVGQARAAAPHRVVVVGGGFGGGTLARYLSRWGGAAVDITLVDPRDAHISCVMSNLVLTGELKTDDLTFSFEDWRPKYGIDHIQGFAAGIDGSNQMLELSDGQWIPYDSLVIATGIAFDAVPGLDPQAAPHAWIAGEQTNLLRDKLWNIPANGTFVMTVPKAPYRCPPGPYERACVVANLLRARRQQVGGSPRVIVLDANPGITAEPETFGRAFRDLYGDIVEYVPDAELQEIDGSQVVTTAGAYHGDVLNVIPNQSAQGLLADSGLTAGGRWAPVDPVTYGSTLAEFPNVYVIGDAQATGQPKSGHMANSQAKVCADAILRSVNGLSSHTQERLDTLTTNSACFSPITADQASWLTAVFRYDPSSGQMAMVPESFGASNGWSRSNYSRMYDWANNLLADTFL